MEISWHLKVLSWLQAWFILSNDKAFGNSSQKSHIQYLDDFNFYKQTLYTQATSDDPATATYIKELLREWDEKVFAAEYSKHNGQHCNSNSDEVINVDNDCDDADEIAHNINLLWMESNEQTPSANASIPLLKIASSQSPPDDTEDFYVDEDFYKSSQLQDDQPMSQELTGMQYHSHFWSCH